MLECSKGLLSHAKLNKKRAREQYFNSGPYLKHPFLCRESVSSKTSNGFAAFGFEQSQSSAHWLTGEAPYAAHNGTEHLYIYLFSTSVWLLSSEDSRDDSVIIYS